MKKIILFAGFTIVLFTTVPSCKRIINKNDNKINGRNVLISIPGISLPSTENGILKFSSANQYFEYTRFLDSICVQTDSLDTVSISSKYLGFESMFSYTSLRSIREQQFEAENEIGWDNLDQVPDKYYTIDKTTLSTLNHLGEIIVANDYYCQSDSFNYVKISLFLFSFYRINLQG